MTYNKKEIIKIVEDFYRDLYNADEQPRAEVIAVIRDVPNITTEEIQKTLIGMKRGRTLEAGISIDLIKGGTVELANLFTKCLINGKSPKA